MVQGSALRLPASAAAGGRSRTLFAAPADPDRRRTMTIRSSYDEGRTWEGVDRGARVSTDWSGYSDLVAVSPEVTGLLYEGGAVDARDEIRFARFTEDWLGPRRAPDPTTRDGAPGARPALVLGGARTTDGGFGRALSFDGRDDAVRLPYRGSLPLGTHDFTCALWFRYDATTGEQPLLWMGGVGSRSPQVALSGDPGHGRITARLTAVDGATPAATAQVATDGAYNDGRWHHLALRRTGGRLLLTVDGRPTIVVARCPGVGQPRLGLRRTPGPAARQPRPVHRRAGRGRRLPARPDRRRTVRRAHAPTPRSSAPPVLRLPLDRVRGGAQS